MSIEGKRLKVQPHVNRGGTASDIYIVGGDIVTVAAVSDNHITVRRVKDGLIDSGPASCFKYMNNKPVVL